MNRLLPPYVVPRQRRDSRAVQGRLGEANTLLALADPRRQRVVAEALMRRALVWHHSD